MPSWKVRFFTISALGNTLCRQGKTTSEKAKIDDVKKRHEKRRFFTSSFRVNFIFYFQFMKHQRIRKKRTTQAPIKENKKKTPEEQQNIPELEITKNGELLTYTLNNMKISKHINNDMYTLKSVSNLLTDNQYKQIAIFLSSLRFQYILQAYDKDYKTQQFVYYIQFDDYIKIGRTFDIKKRYQPKDINDRVHRLVFVNNVDRCERDLIEAFSSHYEKYKGNEGFKITQQEINNSLALFDIMVDRYINGIKIDTEKHVQHYIHNPVYGTGYYLSPLAASIVLNTFGDRRYKECKDFFNTVEMIAGKIDKSDYLSLFVEDGDAFFYWKFHGYTVIVNMEQNLINASRLWNTILETQGKDIENNTFRRFLQLPKIKEMIKQNPELEPQPKTYKNRPLLNGRYMPVIFVHFIVYHLDAQYAFEVAKIMTESLFEKAKKKAIEKQEKKASMSGGDNLYIKKYETITQLLNLLTRAIL